MLHLSTIRLHYDSGFKSVVRLVEELEQQIEVLTLANQSSNYVKLLEKSISSQQEVIQRLSQTVENKSKEIFKLHQSHHQVQRKLQMRLSKTQKINQQLRTRVRELEYLLASGNSSTPKLNSHNSNLPPSLDPPWQKVKRTRSLRKKSGASVGGQLGHQGFTLKQVSDALGALIIYICGEFNLQCSPHHLVF